MKFRKLDSGHKNYWTRRVTESYTSMRERVAEKVNKEYNGYSSKSRCMCIRQMVDSYKNMKDAFLSVLILGIDKESFENLVQFVKDMENLDADKFVDNSDYEPSRYEDY